MLSKKGQENKKDIMGIGQVIYMDVEITKNNKSLDGEEKEDLVFKEQND